MRRIVLVLGLCTLLAGSAWAGGGLHLFGTYGELNEFEKSGGAGGRISVGGEKLVVDLTMTWFPERSGGVVDSGGATIFDELQIVPIEVGLRYVFAPGKELRPYLGAGVSWFVVDLNTGSVDDEAGYYGLAGLVWGDGVGLDLFGEVIYREATVTADYGFAGDFDIDVGGLAAAVGVLIVF
jgi:hypothetical protein